MSLTTRPMTAEELFHLPDDHMRHELVRGEHRTMTPAGFEHGAVIVKLGAPLHQYVAKHRLGLVLGAETGFIVTRNPDTVRAPDVAFVKQARIDAGGIPKAFYPGAPDLAVEVVSPDDSAREVAEKVQDWLAAGCGVVWVVNPAKRTVVEHRPGDVVRTLTDADELKAPDLLPGFSCRVADIFVRSG